LPALSPLSAPLTPLSNRTESGSSSAGAKQEAAPATDPDCDGKGQRRAVAQGGRPVRKCD
jgi:hypothetical protein